MIPPIPQFVDTPARYNATLHAMVCVSPPGRADYQTVPLRLVDAETGVVYSVYNNLFTGSFLTLNLLFTEYEKNHNNRKNPFRDSFCPFRDQSFPDDGLLPGYVNIFYPAGGLHNNPYRHHAYCREHQHNIKKIREILDNNVSHTALHFYCHNTYSSSFFSMSSPM